MSDAIRSRLGYGARPDDDRTPKGRSSESASVGDRAERAAFAEVYRAWAAPVYRYCRVRLGTREAAEDATSATFLRAMAGFEGFRGGSLPAWIFAIARNVVADSARDRARSAEPIESALDRPDPAPGPEDVALAGDVARMLEFMLEPLTADQRQVIELRLAGLTGAEIAVVMGKSKAAVKMQQLRALRCLRAVHLEGTDR